jgi:hypothetical protein
VWADGLRRRQRQRWRAAHPEKPGVLSVAAFSAHSPASLAAAYGVASQSKEGTLNCVPGLGSVSVLIGFPDSESVAPSRQYRPKTWFEEE